MELTEKTSRKGFWGWLRSMFTDDGEKERREQLSKDDYDYYGYITSIVFGRK